MPKEFKNDEIRETKNRQQNGDRSFLSFESDDQERGVEFERAFYNKEFKTYMPQNDVEEVVIEYHKKMMKKKLNESSKQINCHK